MKKIDTYSFRMLDREVEMRIGDTIQIGDDFLTLKKYNKKTNTLYVKINNQPWLYLDKKEFVIN